MAVKMGFVAGIFVVLGLLVAPALAADTSKTENKVILTISGNISNGNSQGEARFDLAMLDALPQASFTTKTIWTEGETAFSGVSLKTLLEAVGAKGNTIRAMALNDYAVEIPVSDTDDAGPIIATKADGKAMSVRDKGPLWIVYPFDSKPEYQTETIYSRSIWQLSAIEIQD